MNYLNDYPNSAKSAIEKDEHLLYDCESNQNALLRTWVSPNYAVILGRGNTPNTEAHINQCHRDKIPVIKRCSGGGTVLIGPGCLCYSLILPTSYHPALSSISTTNTWVMTTLATGLSHHLNLDITVQGHTDLCLGDQKFSGNAQRRLKHSLLFHGTILFNFDLSLISKYLPYPSLSPDYRKNRSHTDFITQLPNTNKTILIQALNNIWTFFQ